MNNDNEIERRLQQAGSRLRADAPDDVAATQAFRRRHDRSANPPRPNRNWWPTLAGVGLVGAAVVGVIAFNAIDSGDSIVSPSDTVVTAPPTTISEVDESVGTPPLPTTTVSDDLACEPGATPPDGSQFLVVACRQQFDTVAVLVAEVPDGESTDAATRWFVDTTMFPDAVIELGPASPVAGLPDTISFLPTLANGASCTVIVQSQGGEWKEACWLDAPIPQVVTDWDGMVVQFDLTDPTAIIGHQLGDDVWKSSGCTIGDVGELAVRSATAGALYGAVGCDGTSAAIVASSIFMQPGGPDGSIWLFERVDDTWQTVDNGTGIETDLPRSIPAHDVWTSWPGDTTPLPTVRDLAELNSTRLFTGLQTREAVADAVLFIIGEARDPEFTGPSFPLTLIGIYDDLIVIESIEGGDDSVAGDAHFIHLTERFDDVGGFEMSHWYTSAICARGGGPDLCV